MHELGLCDAMLRMMDKILTEEEPGAFSIRRVVLEIGELSGVVPRFMEESWSRRNMWRTNCGRMTGRESWKSRGNSIVI